MTAAFAPFATHARLAGLAALLSLSSCVFVADGYQDAEGRWHRRDGRVSIQLDDETSGKEDGGAAQAAKGDEPDEKAFELALARLELEIAKLSADAERAEAGQGLARAEREHAQAVKALEQFESTESPLRLSDGELDVDRARFAVELKQIELEELVAMYKDDQMASSTEEIVVKRDRKYLEFLQRELAMAQTKLAALKGFELPKDLHEKQDAARKAEEGLAKARVEARKAELEAQKSLTEAEHKIAKLEKELAKLGREEPKP